MIIGVSGKIGSGKDTFAQIVGDLQPERNWENKKVAGKLKLIASILTGVHVDDFENQDFKKQHMAPEWDRVVEGYLGHQSRKSMTYREFLQKLGTECLRDRLHANVWVNALFADYEVKRINLPNDPTFIKMEYPNWIITDVRFPNEAQAVRDRGGKLVRINRFTDTGDHPSETALDDWQSWDLVIANQGTISEFHEAIERGLKILQA